jgi:hypothetical protein
MMQQEQALSQVNNLILDHLAKFGLNKAAQALKDELKAKQGTKSKAPQ